MSYYYFGATLLPLSLGEDPPLSSEEFARQCGDHLNQSDLQALHQIAAGDLYSASRHPFVREWREADTQIRNAVARQRAARRRRDPGDYTRPQEGVDSSIEHGVSEAFARPDPLERELALDRLRWRRLLELSGTDPFAGRAVLSYAVRLAIVERWARMDGEAGSQSAESLVAQQARRDPAGPAEPPHQSSSTP
jgi:hypothetical protein